MRNFSISTLVAAASALALVACGSGKISAPSSTAAPSATSTPVSDDAFRAAAEQALSSALLTRADFPAGWSASAPENNELDLPVSDACHEFFADSNTYPGSVAEKESLEFSAGHDESVSSDAGVYRTESAAEQAQAQFADFLARCRGELEQAFTKYLSDTPGVTKAEARFIDEPAPGSGDFSQAFKFAMTLHTAIDTVHMDVHIALMRYGPVLGSISYIDDGTFPPASGDRLVKLVGTRLSKAAESLPE